MGAHPLRDRAFDACSPGILGPELLRLLALSPGQQCLVPGWGRMVMVRRAGRCVCIGSPPGTSDSRSPNLILITWFLNRSTAGVQLRLVLPCGQVAVCCSQSITKSRAAKPSPRFGLPVVVAAGGSDQVDAVGSGDC